MPESTQTTTLINDGWIVAFDAEVIDTVIVAGRTRIGKGAGVDVAGSCSKACAVSCANAWDRFADYWPDNEPHRGGVSRRLRELGGMSR